MKIYAQQGFGEGDKISLGFKNDFIDGVIYSPRHTRKDTLVAKLDEYTREYPEKERLFDPQFYATLYAGEEDWRMGYLEDDYVDYFKSQQKSVLERENKTIECIEKTLRFQQTLKVTGIIAPNIIIPRSFDSREAVISKNFIRNAAEVYAKLKDKRPLFATLAVSYQALSDRAAFEEFLNEITALDTPPDGFYVLISTSAPDANQEFFNATTIAGWMMLNYSLGLNGFKVINGYSDVLAPLLLSVGGYGGATGWFANLRNFSLASFQPPDGGRRPLVKYLSNSLLSRITVPELDQLRELVPQVLNKLGTDSYYSADNASTPQNVSHEVLQTWETIKAFTSRSASKNMPDRLRDCRAAIRNARNIYAAINKTPIQIQAGMEHIEEMDEAIDLFVKRAGLATLDGPR